jgi:hypothetical protein
MKTTGDLVGVFVEFTSCMQDGHNHFESGFAFFVVHAGGDTATIVLNADGVVFVNGDLNMFAVSGKGFIDRVVYHFIDEVMESFHADVTNVHGGPFTDGFEAFEDLDAVCAVTTCMLGDNFLGLCAHTLLKCLLDVRFRIVQM